MPVKFVDFRRFPFTHQHHLWESFMDFICKRAKLNFKFYRDERNDLSMSAACVTKARLVNSRSYSDHDVNCNYMQDAS
jgi:hypothetical protein